MKLKAMIVMLWAMFVLLISFPASAQENNHSVLTDNEARLLYGEFREIRAFGTITVSLVGDGEKIGLDENDLTEFARLQFKNFFGTMRYEEISTDSERFLASILSKDKRIGNIIIRVWVVGNDYPIVYHIKCDAGNFSNPAIWSDEILGHGSKKTAPEAIREILVEMMKDLATNFFKARGQGV